MKLIIDIPNEIKDQLDHTTDCEMEHYWVQHFSLWIADAIKNGVPVTDVKNEVKTNNETDN